MDSLFFHPKLVHLPMALGVLMPLLSAGLLLAWWRDWLPKRVWLVAVALQVALVGSGMLALNSGSAEEERVEKVVAESRIEAHEEAAEAFVWTSAIVLLVMVAAAALGERPSARAVAVAATLGTFAVLWLGYRTGQAGGELVYVYGAAQVYTNGQNAPAVEPGALPAPNVDDDD